MCVHENYKKLKMDFTAREYIDMIITYGMAGQNARAAVRLYAERFPKRERHPTYRTILRCIQRGAETGYLLPHRDNAGAPVHYRDEERILRAFEDNPGNSVRHAAQTLGISRHVVHRVLRQNELHPYHYQRVQQLLPRDAEQSIYFCEGIFI